VVLTFLKNISQWEGLSHILWKNKTCSKPPTSIRSSQFHVFPHTNPTTTSWTSELATGGGGAVSKHGNSPCTDLVSGLSHHFNWENDDETLWKVPLSDQKLSTIIAYLLVYLPMNWNFNTSWLEDVSGIPHC